MCLCSLKWKLCGQTANKLWAICRSVAEQMLNCLGCDCSTCSELLRGLIFSCWCQDVVFKYWLWFFNSTSLHFVVVTWLKEIQLKGLFSEYFGINWEGSFIFLSYALPCNLTLFFSVVFGESKEKQTDSFLGSRSFPIIFCCSHYCSLKISGFEPSFLIKCYIVALSGWTDFRGLGFDV